MKPMNPSPPTHSETSAELREPHEQTSFGKTGWTAEFYDEEAQWVVRRHDRVIVAEQCSEETARFIAASRNAIPEILTALEEAEARADRLQGERNQLSETLEQQGREIGDVWTDSALQAQDLVKRAEAAEAESKALRDKLDAVREGWGHLTASMNKGNEGVPAWFTVSVEDVAAFDSTLAPTPSEPSEGKGLT